MVWDIKISQLIQLGHPLYFFHICGIINMSIFKVGGLFVFVVALRFPQCQMTERNSFMQPPLLTKREFEILEFLAVGATREEIAHHLKISPETVKLHAKNIFRKFDITSYRDGAAEVQKFITAYGDNGMGYQLFHTSVEVSIIVNEARTQAGWMIESTGYVVRGEVTELSLMFVDDNIISDVILNGQPAKLDDGAGLLLHFRVPLAKPIAQGETLVRQSRFVETARAGQKISDVTYASGTPTENLKITLTAFGNVTPLTCKSLLGIRQVAVRDLPNATVQQIENTVEITISDPQMDQMFVIT